MVSYKLDKNTCSELTKKANIYKQIVELISKYYDDIYKIIEREGRQKTRIFENSSSSVKNILAEIDEKIAKLCGKSLEFDDMVNYAFDLFDDFQSIINDISTMKEIALDPEFLQQLVYGMSQTFVSEINQSRSLINNIYNRLRSIDDSHIYSMLYNAMNPGENHDKISEHILLTKSANGLIIFIVSELIKEGRGSAELLAKIEEFKNNALFGQLPRPKYSPEKYPSIIQKVLVRHGLSPAMPFKPYGELLKMFGAKNIDEIKAKYTIVTINKYTEKYVEFNILPLIDHEYVRKNDMETTATSGLNNRVIKRYETIRAIETKSDNEDKSPKIEIIHNKSAEKAIIFEILNDKMWRVIGPNAGEFYTPVKIALKFADPPLRPHQYNKEHEDMILDRAIDKGHRNNINSYIQEKQSIVPADTLKRDANKHLLQNFIELFEKNWPENMKDLGHLMSDYEKEIKGIITRLLIKLIADTDNIEFYITFGVRMHNLFESFMKEYKGKVYGLKKSNVLKESIFAEYKGKDLKNYVAGYMKDIIHATIETLDKPPSLWAELEYSLKEHVMRRKHLIL